MKMQDILLLGGLGIGGYFAYNWWTSQQAAASASSATTAQSATTSQSATSASMPQSSSGATTALPPAGQGQYGYPMPGYMDEGGSFPGMYVSPPVQPAPVPAIAFGVWFSRLPPARRAALARLPMAARLAAYHSWAAQVHARRIPFGG